MDWHGLSINSIFVCRSNEDQRAWEMEMIIQSPIWHGDGDDHEDLRGLERWRWSFNHIIYRRENVDLDRGGFSSAFFLFDKLGFLGPPCWGKATNRCQRNIKGRGRDEGMDTWWMSSRPPRISGTGGKSKEMCGGENEEALTQCFTGYK
jgi:hypothetical protein